MCIRAFPLIPRFSVCHLEEAWSVQCPSSTLPLGPSISCSLFVVAKKVNPFGIKQIQPLFPKYRGGVGIPNASTGCRGVGWGIPNETTGHPGYGYSGQFCGTPQVVYPLRDSHVLLCSRFCFVSPSHHSFALSLTAPPFPLESTLAKVSQNKQL